MKRTLARGRTLRRQPGVMNKTEGEYALLLEARKRQNEILDYWFEGMTFKLAHDCRFTPDFIVQLHDGVLECHEVKGFIEDDALVKIKVAAQMFPFRFLFVHKLPKKEGGGWKVREF